MGKLYLAEKEADPRLAGWLFDGNSTPLQRRIVERSFLDVGIREKPEGSNRGTRIDRYVRRAGIEPPVWWCACWAGVVFIDSGCLVPRGYPLTDEWLPHCVRGDGQKDEAVIGAAILYGVRKAGPIVPWGNAHHIGIVADIVSVALGAGKYKKKFYSNEGNRAFSGSASNNGIAVDFGPVLRTDILGFFHPRTTV